MKFVWCDVKRCNVLGRQAPGQKIGYICMEGKVHVYGLRLGVKGTQWLLCSATESPWLALNCPFLFFLAKVTLLSLVGIRLWHWRQFLFGWLAKNPDYIEILLIIWLEWHICFTTGRMKLPRCLHVVQQNHGQPKAHPSSDTSCDIIPELLEGVLRHAPPHPSQPPSSLHTIFGIFELKFMLQRKSTDFHLVDTIVN